MLNRAIHAIGTSQANGLRFGMLNPANACFIGAGQAPGAYSSCRTGRMCRAIHRRTMMLRAVWLLHRRQWFSRKGIFQHPVQAVLNAPVAAHRLGDQSRSDRQPAGWC